MANGCEKHEKFTLEGGCPSCVHEDIDVTVPVTVRANACVGEVHCGCMRAAIVTKNCDKAAGSPHAVDKFTVKQHMCVDIPLTFGVETEIGEACVDFDVCPDTDSDRANRTDRTDVCCRTDKCRCEKD